MDPVWGPTAGLRRELARNCGDTLIRFLTVDPERRLVTKSPSIENLELFFDFSAGASRLADARRARRR